MFQWIWHLAGYAVAVGERNNAVGYFAGAPRSGHVGQVVLFKNGGMNWTVAQKISGNQVSHSTFIKHEGYVSPKCATEIPIS